MIKGKMAIVPILFLIAASALFGTERQTLRFGYSSSQNPEVLIERMTPLMNLLSESLDVNIEFIHKKTFSEMQKAYINQEIDFGIINAYSFLRILPYNSVDPIAARKIGDSTEYCTYFFTRKDSGIESFADLKGKTIALGDPYSTSSYLIPHYIFRNEGILPETDFEKTIIISKQDSLIFAVLNRTADVGVCASFIFEEQPEFIRNSFNVFSKSQSFPLGPFIANRNLDRDLVEKLKLKLLSLSESEEGRAALEYAGMDGFESVQIDTYFPLLELKDSMDLN